MILDLNSYRREKNAKNSASNLDTKIQQKDPAKILVVSKGANPALLRALKVANKISW